MWEGGGNSKVATAAVAPSLPHPSISGSKGRRPLAGSGAAPWSSSGRPGRSVGGVGNQTETTRRIASLHYPGSRFAAAASGQVQFPAGSAQPWRIRRVRQGGGRGQRGDPPASDGGGRLIQGR